MTPYTSMSPYNNIPHGQGLASETYERELTTVVNNEVPFGQGSKLFTSGFASSPECLTSGTGCPAYLNPLIIDAIQKVSHLNPRENTEYLPCQSMNTAPELAGLCNALLDTRSTPYFGKANYPIKICHHEMDDVSLFVDMTKRFPNKKNIRRLPTQEQLVAAEKNRGFEFSHSSCALICDFYAVLDVLATTNM